MQNLKSIEGNYNAHLNALNAHLTAKKIITWRMKTAT